MRRIATCVLVLAAIVTLGCASGRNVQYTFSKSNQTQMQVMQDAEKLRGVSGVTQVLPQVDSRGNATLQVFIDEENQFSGIRHAIEGLGYQIVTP